MSEVLFDPRYVIKTDDTSMMDQDGPDLSNTTNLPFLPITHLVRQALNGVDIDVRSSLLSNIIVTGGSSLMPGLVERLHSELYTVIPGSKIKISAPGSTTERKYSAWIGGSILSSLGTFHQLWVSKQQYEEMGTAVEKKMH